VEIGKTRNCVILEQRNWNKAFGTKKNWNKAFGTKKNLRNWNKALYAGDMTTNFLICLRAYIPDNILLHILSVLLFQERFSSTVTPRVLHWKTCLIGLPRIITGW
jgi:hypothetical protein